VNNNVYFDTNYFFLKVTHVTDDIPGCLSCFDSNSITAQIIALLLRFFIGKFIPFLKLQQIFFYRFRVIRKKMKM